MIGHSPADRRLLAALARILRLVDPVPAEVVSAAEALRVDPCRCGRGELADRRVTR
jgi:hypothetical protein